MLQNISADAQITSRFTTPTGAVYAVWPMVSDPKDRILYSKRTEETP